MAPAPEVAGGSRAHPNCLECALRRHERVGLPTVTQREERTFELDPAEVAAARRFAAGVLKGWGCESDDVVLAIGELAANAVLHARTHFAVILSMSDAGVRVEVADYNPRLPVAVEPPAGAVSGRGLMLVEAVSRAWGVHPEATAGKRIWAEFTVR